MALTAETKRNLRHERDVLRRQIEAIDALLDDDSASEEAAETAEKPEATASPILRTGLRKEIRKTLAKAGRGLKPKEIAKKIEASGFTSEAKTPLSTRIANECWRMAKPGGSLTKRAGRYSLKEKPAAQKPTHKLAVVPAMTEDDEHFEPTHRASA